MEIQIVDVTPFVKLINVPGIDEEELRSLKRKIQEAAGPDYKIILTNVM